MTCLDIMEHFYLAYRAYHLVTDSILPAKHVVLQGHLSEASSVSEQMFSRPVLS